MVRLKGNEETRQNLELAFQFHYGTIKRTVERAGCAQAVKFQFHYGTIKRWKLLSCNLLTPLHFNSTMVRLKAT